MDHLGTAVYDVNILYPAPLRDLIIRLAQAGLVQEKWTDTIHEEWMRNVLKDRPDLSPQRLARTNELMNEALRDCHKPPHLWYTRVLRFIAIGPPPRPQYRRRSLKRVNGRKGLARVPNSYNLLQRLARSMGSVDRLGFQ